MSKYVLRVLALVLVLAMLIPTVSMNANEKTETELVTAMVILPGSGSQSAIAGHVERVIAPYNSFVMAELTQDQKSYLESMGMAVVIDDNLHAIGIDGYAFDTRDGEPVVKENLRFKPAAGVEDSYIVQFVGPIKNEWLSMLNGMGAEQVTYYPYNSMLVRMTPETRTVLGSLDFVQWVGGYHPAYKIRPSLMELNENEVRDVKIITYEPDGIDAVRRYIDKVDVFRNIKASDFGLIKAWLTLDEIEVIATLPEVSYIEPIYDMELMNARIQWILQTNIQNNRKIWSMGINGSSQIVSISDTGLDYDHNMFRESAGQIASGDLFNITDTNRRKLVRYQPMAQWYDDNGIDVDNDGVPEMEEDFEGDGIAEAISDSSSFGGFSGHGTTTTGTLAGNDTNVGVSQNDGSAAGAQIYFQDVGGKGIDSQTGLPDDMFWWIPDDYYWLFIDPYLNGSYIHSNSWGSRVNEYDLESMMIDKFMWENPDFLVLFPTGNEGLAGPGSPSTAKSIVSVGWTNTAPSQDNINGGSSKGPTIDGRRSPTLVAPGITSTSVSTGDPTDNIFTDMETSTQGGSYSVQAVGGAAAMIRDYFAKGFYPNGAALAGNSFMPSAALVKAMLMNSCEMVTGLNADQKTELRYPNNSQGWGRPLLDGVLYFAGDSRKTLVVDNEYGLNTGEVAEYEFNVVTNTLPIEFSLAWSDYPAAAGTVPAIVNNLNLQVEAPNGTTFWGNRFQTSIPSPTMWNTRGYSLPGGAPDLVNTDEGINITAGNAFVDNWVTPGVWKARIIAQNVPVGPQPFGLVVTGDLDMTYGIVTIDKQVYGESDTINVEVRDTNAVAVSVDLTSDTETVAETLALTETVAGSGIWRGSMNTEFNIPAADGILQVKEGNTITVSYTDANPAHVSTVTAVVDASGPMITNVGVKDVTNAVATVTWDTDEPSTSKVYYGETPTLERPPVEFNDLMVNHELELEGLKTDTMYYFDVESADADGHTTRDDNGGQHYTFATIEKAEILVVFGDETFDKEERYRLALEAKGWSYNEWFAEKQGDPPLSTLQEYKVVIWQTGYEQYPPISDSQRPLITNYLDGGGRLFISSHDIAWSSCDTSSQYYRADRCNWFNSTLKVRYEEDPYSWPQIVGKPGNAISQNYFTMPYPSYTPHRDGAAGDEITCTAIDGICEYTWENTQHIPYNPVVGDISIQWTSSANNGTAGTGVWGGKPSKMVVFFGEFTRIDHIEGVDSSAIRDDILDKTIIWLLDVRDHPDVYVTYPDGGEVFTGNNIQIQWSAVTSGTNINAQELYYSDNEGQSWMYITTLGAGVFQYDWDISMIPNGNRYLVKVKVIDDGTPTLLGSDISNSTFSIQKPGGDLEGPLTIPGSIRVAPHYVDSGATAWINASVDDSNRGNSTVTQAEYFIQCVEPDVANFGTGTAMGASDGSFDMPLEGVTWSGTLNMASAWYRIWVHGRDAENNWGPFESRRFLLLDGVTPADLLPPIPALNVDIAMQGVGNADLNISWDASPNDDGNPANVEFYDVYTSDSFARNGTGYQLLTTIPAVAAPSYSVVDAGKGDGDPSNYFYFVTARDNSCNIAQNATQLAKYIRPLSVGMNLASIPLELSISAIDSVLPMASIDVVWWYDATDPADHWKSYNPLKTVNDLASVTYDKALWIEANAAADILVVGKIPTKATISLEADWNFVGYPTFIPGTVQDSLMGIGYQRVEGIGPSGDVEKLGDTSDMMTGYGYWIKVGSPQVWTIEN